MITQEFLHDVAEYSNGRVAKVVINDTYEITNFEVKEVTDNVLALNYIVPAGSVSVVTKIELKDSSDKLISSNTVNVPITTDTMMIQSIEVKEG
nr:ketopantoate hydroxymethyltransferase [Aneurinibacillus sp. XH2]